MPWRTSRTVAVLGPAHVWSLPRMDVNHIPLGLPQQGAVQ